MLRALNIADEVTGKLDKIIAQLRKLDSIETTLNRMCDRGAKIGRGGGGEELKSNTSVMEEKFKEADTKVKEMDTGLTGLNEQVEQLQKKIKYIKDSKKKELNSFETTLCCSVQPKRKAAFLFFMFIFFVCFGIPERKTKDGDDTQNLCINSSRRNVFGLDDPANNIEFKRVQRF